MNNRSIISEVSASLNFDNSDVELSLENDEKYEEKNQRGGFFWNTKDTSVENLVWEAIEDMEWRTACFLIERATSFDLNKVDKRGNTILHYLPKLKKENLNVVAKLVSKPNFEEVVNKQNDQGNTALHEAVFAGEFRLAKLFKANGAKTDIKNNDGFFVIIDELSKGLRVTSEGEFLSDTEPVKTREVLQQQSQDEGITESLNFLDSDTEELQGDNITDNEFQKEFQKEFQEEIQENPQAGGKRKLDKYKPDVSEMSEIYGYRKLIMDPDAGDKKDTSQIVKAQAKTIHKDVVEMISKLLDVDESKAKLYKSGLWSMVREQFPDLTSNLEKSLKMKKIATKANLNKIDIEKIKIKIQEMIKNNKRNNNRSQKANTPKQSKESEDFSIMSMDQSEEKRLVNEETSIDM